jgi:aminocarboxymuconate-semialdehyde decarboxylase
MLVDMHAHVIPENFPPAGNRASANSWPAMDHFEPGRARVMIGGEVYRAVHSGNWDYERRLRDMANTGVDVEVISPMPELSSYWYTPEDALEMSRYLNEFILKLCEREPTRFIGLGNVPLQAPDLAAKELENIKKMGLTGIELGSNVDGRSLGMPEFQEFFQEVERLDMPIFVHALRPTMMDRLQQSLFNPIGYPTDTGLSIATLIQGGTAEKCPNLRIAFSHAGGTFPFVLPRYEHNYRGVWNEEPIPEGRTAGGPGGEGGGGQRLPHSPAEYARRFFYDTLIFDRRAITYLIEMIGAKQLLIGSDYPYMQREVPVGKTVSNMGLDPMVVEDITWNNCFRFLGIEAPVPARAS